jgi:hypothetical protein
MDPRVKVRNVFVCVWCGVLFAFNLGRHTSHWAVFLLKFIYSEKATKFKKYIPPTHYSVASKLKGRL